MPIFRKVRRRQRARDKKNNIDLIPVMTGTKPWYTSKTFMGLIATVLSMIFIFLKLEIPAQQIDVFVAAVFAFLGQLLAAFGRKAATKRIE